MKRWISGLLLLYVSLQCYAQVIPGNRLVDWSRAEYPVGKILIVQAASVNTLS